MTTTTNNRGSIYVAGPMRGYPEFNFPAFHRAASRLRKAGWDVVSPAELDDALCPFEVSTREAWEWFLRRDIALIAGYKGKGVDAIFLLYGWERSEGALLEFDTARRLGATIFFESEGGIHG